MDEQPKMRHWIVHRNDTVEAIIEAIRTGQCKSEADVEAIAEQFNDYVTWASDFTSEIEQEAPEEELDL